MGYHKKAEPSLFRIILGILVVGGVIAGVIGAVRLLGGRSGAPGEAGGPDRLAAAKELMQNGELDEARAILTPVAEATEANPYAQDAVVLLAKLEEDAGSIEKALAWRQMAFEEFEASPEHPAYALDYARLLDKTGAHEEAAAVYTKVAEEASAPWRVNALVCLGHHAAKRGKLAEARGLYQQALDDAEWDTEPWQAALDGLGPVNVALVFLDAETPDNKFYAVEKGDTLTGIGAKLNTTLGMLMRANNLTADTVLQLGQRLRYTPKEFHIVIERSTCRLFLLDKDGPFKCYPVGLGMKGHETILGSYKIGDKQKNPTWWKKGEGSVPPGDPGNELGTRWMPLVPQEEGLPSDLGIHGALDPGTVGEYSSHGCARMVTADVEELYDLVVRSTPVDIVDVFRPEQAAP